MVRLRLKAGILMVPDKRTGETVKIEIRPNRKKNPNYEVDVPEAAAEVMLKTQQWERVSPPEQAKPEAEAATEDADWTGEGSAKPKRGRG